MKEASLLFQFCATSVAWSYTLHSDASGDWFMIVFMHTIVTMLIRSVVNTVIMQLGYDPDADDFAIMKPDSSKRPVLSLAHNLVLVVLSYFTSYQIESTHVEYWFIFYSSFFVYRLWKLVYPKLPLTMQAFPLFNLTSTAFLLLVLTSMNEWPSVRNVIETRMPPDDPCEGVVCT